LYCPDFDDVLIRNPQTWEEKPVGAPGVIDVVSTLPRSYPGHVLLTEDLGVYNGIDDGDWSGKHFSVLGSLPKAEARGCSDTFSVLQHDSQAAFPGRLGCRRRRARRGVAW
jgi:hypothetical protein